MSEYRFEMAATKDLPTHESLEEALRDQVLDHPELWVKVPDYLAGQVESIPVRRSPHGTSVYYPFNWHGIRTFGGLVVEEQSDVDNGIWIRQYADATDDMLDQVKKFNEAVTSNTDDYDVSFLIRGEWVDLVHNVVTLP